MVSGITLNKNEAKVTVCDLQDQPGIAAKIFDKMAEHSVNVDMIVQNVSHLRKTDISFTVAKTDLAKAVKFAKEVSSSVGAGEVLQDEDIARISVVGVGMKTHPGVAAMMFAAFAANKINIEMISTSDISISCVIKKKSAEEAVRILHDKFGLGKKK